MKLELKNIKHSVFASQETFCYEGVVYIDGKKSLYVSNDGRGASDNLEPIGSIPYSIIQKADNWCKKNLPKWKGCDDDEYHTTFEMWCHEEVNQFLIRKELKNKLTKCVMFFKNGDLMESRYKNVKKLSGVHMNHFKANHKGVKVILNEMPFDNAFKHYNEFLERTE
tara:strand:+ start:39 stop:539 length:501 start_codon:yes stop_codon:yes gene_type:complete